MKRVIENLVLNALKHSMGSVTIDLKSIPSFVELAIRNPAPQLKEEDLFHLFDCFYKADQATQIKSHNILAKLAK